MFKVKVFFVLGILFFVVGVVAVSAQPADSDLSCSGDNCLATLVQQDPCIGEPPPVDTGPVEIGPIDGGCPAGTVTTPDGSCISPPGGKVSDPCVSVVPPDPCPPPVINPVDVAPPVPVDCPAGTIFVPSPDGNGSACVTLGGRVSLPCGWNTSFQDTVVRSPQDLGLPPDTEGFFVTRPYPFVSLGMEAQVLASSAFGIQVTIISADSQGLQGITLTPEQLSQMPTQVSENTLIGQSWRGYIKVYLLTTGEYQVNIGPDREGKVRVVIFNGVNATTAYGYQFNVNNIN